jgi:hypothetical protein
MIRRALLAVSIAGAFVLAVPQQAESQSISNWCSSISPSLCQAYSLFEGGSQVPAWLEPYIDDIIETYQPILAERGIDVDLAQVFGRRPPVSVPEPPGWLLVIPGLAVLAIFALRRRGDGVA